MISRQQSPKTASTIRELLRLCETLRAAPERYSYQELIDCCISAQSSIESFDCGHVPSFDHAAGIVLFRLVVNAWAILVFLISMLCGGLGTGKLA